MCNVIGFIAFQYVDGGRKNLFRFRFQHSTGKTDEFLLTNKSCLQTDRNFSIISFAFGMFYDLFDSIAS